MAVRRLKVVVADDHGLMVEAIKIAVLSAVDSDETAEEALRLGASTFISKRVDPLELPDALLAALGRTVHEPVGRADPKRAPALCDPGLTDRDNPATVTAHD